MIIESYDYVLIAKTDSGLYVSKIGGWHLTKDINKAEKWFTEKQIKQTISTYRLFTKDRKTKFIFEKKIYRVSSDSERTGFVEQDSKVGMIQVLD